VAAFQHGLSCLGAPLPSQAEVRALIGRPALAMLSALGCPAEQADTVFVRHVRPFYLDNFARLARAYPGAAETLEALVRSGWSCQSHHSKPQPEYLAEVISQFDPVAELWHVEDTPEGIEMGLANGAVTVFAEYGYGQLKDRTPHYRIQAPSQLLALVAAERLELA
ncbi:MAG TPA: hypothetical protein VGO93_01895, partial [Candidatus Xenobia bacterium]